MRGSAFSDVAREMERSSEAPEIPSALEVKAMLERTSEPQPAQQNRRP